MLRKGYRVSEMEQNLVVTSALTALTVGLSCGTCCSPVISLFLSSYIVSHAGGLRRAFVSSAGFFLGKVISVVTLCLAASVLGRRFISENGYIGGFPLRHVLQAAMSFIGVWLIVSWIREIKGSRVSAGMGKEKQAEGTAQEKRPAEAEGHHCKGCPNCGGQKPESGFFAMLMAGMVYGATPCAPMLVMIGYTIALPVSVAGITGCVFGMSSILTPVTLLVLVSGILSGQIAKEIPNCLKWFRLASYILLAVLPLVIRV